MSDNTKYYLLSAKISGIKNIHKRIELDFYLKSIDKSFNPEKYRVKGIFGENGFGKTAIITAFSLYQSLLIRASYLSDSSIQAYLEETINKKTHKFVMECEFARVNDGDIKVYSHSICIERVSGLYQITEECLNVKNGNYRKSKYIPVFKVLAGEIDTIVAGANIDSLWRTTANLLSKASLSAVLLANGGLSAGDPLTDSVNSLIGLSFRMVVSLRTEDQHEQFFIKGDYYENRHYSSNEINSFSNVSGKRVLRAIYPVYERRVQGMERFIKLFKPDLKSIDIFKQEDGEYYVCQLNMNYGDYIINKEFESEGIKKLVSIYDALRAASNGGIVFIDEMDANINSIYLSTIIEYMMLYGKGQLCFTSHNIDIMHVLKDNKYSIDFLNSNQEIIRWQNNGNKSPVNTYKNGLIEGMPYNIFPADYIGVFGED